MTDSSSKAQRPVDARQRAFLRLQRLLNSRSSKKRFLLSRQWREWSLDRLDPGWIYAMQFRLEHGRWVVAELKVFPESDLLNWDRMKHWIAEPVDFPEIPLGGLTARQLRRISFTQPMVTALTGLMKAAKAIARQYNRRAGHPSGLGVKPITRLDGMKRIDNDRKLARIVAKYVDLLRRRSRRPTAECAQRLGLSHSRVRDAIHQARARKLLTGSRGQGWAGGELTSYALALLNTKRSARKGSSARDRAGR